MSLEASQQGAGLRVQRVAAVGVLLPATGDRPGIAGTDVDSSVSVRAARPSARAACAVSLASSKVFTIASAQD